MQRLTKQHEAGYKNDVVLHLHPNWVEFIQQCENLEHGEVLRLKIQDGLPMAAEIVKRRVVFSRKNVRPIS